MPEGPELMYMAEVICQSSKKVGPFVGVSYSELATHPQKHPRLSIPWASFDLSAKSRGKELIITITPSSKPAATKSKRARRQPRSSEAAYSDLNVLFRAGMVCFNVALYECVWCERVGGLNARVCEYVT